MTLSQVFQMQHFIYQGFRHHITVLFRTFFAYLLVAFSGLPKDV
jgi:hypothetical protein